MSIVRIPSLLHCQTIQDWVTILQKHPTLLSQNQHKHLNIFSQNAIIYLSLQGLATFYTCCALFEGKVYLLHGTEPLIVLHRFILQNEPIDQREWHFPQPFPTKNESSTFSELSKEFQKNILSTKIPHSDCRAETLDEFKMLCRFYHETEALISSPI